VAALPVDLSQVHDVTTRRPLLARAALALVAATLLAYLREPPWTASVTSGLRGWEMDADGQRFRWTTGRASFFVPSDAEVVHVPLRALMPPEDPRPFHVEILVDGRLVDRVTLGDERWQVSRLRVSPIPTRRRFRRVDLRIDRAWGEWRLGVQLGEVGLAQPPPGLIRLPQAREVPAAIDRDGLAGHPPRTI
jgi:hypothetical protein